MLTTAPQYTDQPNTLCPVTNRVVFVPRDTIAHEWKACEACGSAHRVLFIDGDKRKPTLRSI